MRKGIFDRIAINKIKGSNFDLSHETKTSFNIGQIIPTCQLEVLPGDKFKINTESMFRMAPMVTPPMHKLDISHHWFFIPYRLLWPEWEDWITGQTEVAPPTCASIQTIQDHYLANYLGYRSCGGSNTQEHSAFPIAAYCLVFDEFYRAQFIRTTETFAELSTGTTSAYTTELTGRPFQRTFEADYFTSCLPNPQVGDAVELPLLSGDDVDVTLKSGSTNPIKAVKAFDQSDLGATGGLKTGSDSFIESAVPDDIQIDPNGTLEVDISAEVTDINTLREAFALQRWLEKEQRAGQRYIEQTLAFWGVKSSDERFHRPEYIGGTKQPMVISEVLATSEVAGTPVGDMAGHGISVGSGGNLYFEAEEHGLIMCMTSILPATSYYQGMDRMFFRTDRYDYANPMFANLGEQEVYSKELYCVSTETQTQLDTVFGYIPRFSEYKFIPDRIQGEFTDVLEYWHLGRKFSSRPTLNTDFIECDYADFNRIFASITGSDQIYGQIQNNIRAYRKLPKYGIPSIV